MRLTDPSGIPDAGEPPRGGAAPDLSPSDALRAAARENRRLLALTVAIGAACGLASVGFHHAIERITALALDRALAAPGRSWILWTLLSPALGGLASGVAQRALAPRARPGGVPQVKATYAAVAPPLRARDAAATFALSALQIGTGASLGREGPTVHFCAGIASRLGRFARASPEAVRRLLPVGAAAGIAAAFHAPIAAVTFVVEEVVGGLNATVLSGAVVAAAVAAVVDRSVLGPEALLAISPAPSFLHTTSLLLCLPLGVLAGGVGLGYTESILGARRRFRALAAVPAWARPALGGLATGALAVLALVAFAAPGVAGGGYGALSDALSGRLAASVLLPLCALKLLATAASFGSGGVGGIFAPALVLGAMLGGSVGAADVALLGHSSASLGAFAAVGMGAVFAGAMRAPITAVLITVEMTGAYSLMVPLMIASTIAYALARRARPTPIYDALLQQDGVHLPDEERHGAAAAGASRPPIAVPSADACQPSALPSPPAENLAERTERGVAMVNKVILVGNLGKDPEVRYTAGGQAVASLRIATSRSWTDKASGQRKEETEWHDVEVWGKQAEQCGEYLAKGRQVYVEGRLKTDKWQDKQSGQDRYRVKVVADTVRFLGGGGRGAGAGAGAGGRPEEVGGPPPGFEEGPGNGGGPGGDDIPF